MKTAYYFLNVPLGHVQVCEPLQVLVDGLLSVPLGVSVRSQDVLGAQSHHCAEFQRPLAQSEGHCKKKKLKRKVATAQ